MSDFLSWFKNVGGVLDSSVGITDFPGMGRGAIAIKDIPEGSTLFTIPRNILLSTRTTTLRQRLGEADWAALGTGWQPLIVSMMWEESRGDESPWKSYLEDLPNQFDSLMFWSEEELAELQASTIKDKIGRADAERDFMENVYPVICRRSDVFAPALLESHFSGERFHINGSRILSRSFQVEEWESEELSGHNGDSDHGSPMSDKEGEDVVPTLVEHVEVEPIVEVEGDLDDLDDEDKEKVEDVAMVPMADILNARYGSENAKLFYEKDVLRMISTKDIPCGEQIWNTYGDPPNANLLRLYGHVDLIPIEGDEIGATSTPFPYGNPADEVEIRADLLLDICLSDANEDEKRRRADIWLSLGGDDTFAIDKNDLTCKDMLGMIKFLSMTEVEVQETIEKEKLPKGKPSGEILIKAIATLRARLSQYTSSIEEDEVLLSALKGSPNRLFNANFVRMCEKRLLRQAIEQAETILAQEVARSKGKMKRAREEEKETRRDRKKIKR